MIYFTEAALDSFIKEDVPTIDLTTTLMGIGNCRGKLEFRVREAGVVACTEEAARMMEKLGVEVTHFTASGTSVEAGVMILAGNGEAGQLHMAWKVCLNILEYCCGIATHTQAMVKKATAVQSDISVAVTRKFMPGTKELVIKSAMAGGAVPHRLGLSETLLVFEQHRVFIMKEAFEERLKEMKRRVPEKKLIVETDNLEEALWLINAGVDSIQFDKVPALQLKDWVEVIRAKGKPVTLIAAGGVNIKNADQYAQTGVDVLVTSSLFHGKPLDISAKMEMLQAHTE